MTDQEINIAIAEACGWKQLWEKQEVGTVGWWELNGKYNEQGPPNYCSDLNAMHEAEQCITPHFTNEDEPAQTYIRLLEESVGRGMAVFASARQRAEAFLRTIGKWKD